MRILVLDAHSNAALACVQSLGRAGHGVVLGAVDPRVPAWRSRYPVERLVYPDPFHDPGCFQAWLREICDRRDLDLVLPVTDATVHPAMSVRDQPSIGKKCILPAPESYEWIFDKEKTIELARRVGVPVPETTVFRRPEEIRSFEGALPLFVKPARSKAWLPEGGRSLSAALVRSRRELEIEAARLLRWGPVLVQSYVHGSGVGIELLSDRGEIVLSFAHRRIHEYPMTGGGSTYRVSIEMPPRLLDAARRLLAAVGWHGVAMVEFKQSGEDFRLMEVNGRFWESLPLGIRAGVDFPRGLIELWSGRRPGPQPRYAIGLHARNFPRDLVWFMANLRADRSDPHVLSRPPGTVLLEYGRVLTRREVWDHATWRDPLPFLDAIARILSGRLAGAARGAQDRRRARAGARETRERLRRLAPRRLLLVCHGNICRSAFAAKRLEELLGGGFEIRSAGLHPVSGRRPPQAFLECARAVGVDLGGHSSTVVSSELLEWAEAVVIMDAANHRRLSTVRGVDAGRLVWLGAFDPEAPSPEIPDPLGKPEDEVAAILSRMDRALRSLARELRAVASR